MAQGIYVMIFLDIFGELLYGIILKYKKSSIACLCHQWWFLYFPGTLKEVWIIIVQTTSLWQWLYKCIKKHEYSIQWNLCKPNLSSDCTELYWNKNAHHLQSSLSFRFILPRGQPSSYLLPTRPVLWTRWVGHTNWKLFSRILLQWRGCWPGSGRVQSGTLLSFRDYDWGGLWTGNIQQ